MEAMQLMAIRVSEFMRSLRENEEGQGMVEYALILGLVAVVATATLTTIGNEISRVFGEILAKFK